MFKATDRRQKAVIFDMDGTLVDTSSIRHIVQRKNPLSGGKRDFDAFAKASIFCPPNEWVAELARKYADSGHAILVVSARKEKFRRLSENWLDKNEVPHEVLVLRHRDDRRADRLVKATILKNLLAIYDVVHAVDDNPNVIALWEANGIPVTVVPGWEV